MDLQICIERYLASGFARPGEMVGHWRNARGDVCVLVMFQREPQALFELGVFKPEIGSWGHDLNGFTLSRQELEAAIDGQREIYGTDLAGLTHVREGLRVRLNALFAPKVAAKPVSQPATQPATVPYWRSSHTVFFSLAAEPLEADFVYRPATMSNAAWLLFLQAAAADSDMQEYCDALPAAALQRQPTTLRIPLAAAPLVWMSCLQHCEARSVGVDSLDTLFADLACAPIDTDGIDPDLAMAWPIWLGLVDVATLRRAALPWWLGATATVTESAIGLLAPHEVRMLASHIDGVLQLVVEIGGVELSASDRQAIAVFVREAAETQRWLVGLESGT